MQRRGVGHVAVFQIILIFNCFFPSRKPNEDKQIFQFFDFICNNFMQLRNTYLSITGSIIVIMRVIVALHLVLA